MPSISLSSALEVENTLQYTTIHCSSLDILVLFTVSSCIYFSVGNAPQHVIPTLNITALLLSTFCNDKITILNTPVAFPLNNAITETTILSNKQKLRDTQFKKKKQSRYRPGVAQRVPGS
jgi:hypothetical protein